MPDVYRSRGILVALALLLIGDEDAPFDRVGGGVGPLLRRLDVFHWGHRYFDRNFDSGNDDVYHGARYGGGDLVDGNIIGSGISQITLAIGIVALISRIEADHRNVLVYGGAMLLAW